MLVDRASTTPHGHQSAIPVRVTAGTVACERERGVYVGVVVDAFEHYLGSRPLAQRLGVRPDSLGYGGRLEETMLAYKFLDAGRSPFTGWWWEPPAGGQPGPWLEVSGRLELCVNGLHACTVAQLAPWMTTELWVVELAGEIVERELALVASRARLVEPVLAWDEAARVRFAGHCAARARQFGTDRESAAVLVEAIAAMAAGGRAAAAGYWSAVLAGEAAAGQRSGPGYDGAFAVERAVQAAWLAVELQVAP